MPACTAAHALRGPRGAAHIFPRRWAPASLPQMPWETDCPRSLTFCTRVRGRHGYHARESRCLAAARLSLPYQPRRRHTCCPPWLWNERIVPSLPSPHFFLSTNPLSSFCCISCPLAQPPYVSSLLIAHPSGLFPVCAGGLLSKG